MFTCLFNMQMHLFCYFLFSTNNIFWSYFSPHQFFPGPPPPPYPTIFKSSSNYIIFGAREISRRLYNWRKGSRIVGRERQVVPWQRWRGPFNLHMHSGLGFSHRFHESLSLLLLFGMMGNSRVYNGYTTKWMPATSLKHILEEGSDSKIWQLKF